MNHTQATPKGSEPAKKRRRIWPLKIALLVLALLPAFLLLKLVFILTAVPTISVDYAAELNRISMPKGYEPNQNAAPYYERAYGYHLSRLPVHFYSLRDLWPGDMNDTQLEMVKDWLALNANTITCLEEAVSRPYYWIRRHSNFGSSSPRANTIEFFKTIEFYQLANCLRFQVKLDLYQAQLERALEHSVAIHKMGSHLSARTTFHEWPLGIYFKDMAVNTIFAVVDRYDLPPTQLAHFQARMEREIRQSEEELDSRCDKVVLYDIIQSVFTDNGRGNGTLIPRQAYTVIEPVIISLISATKEQTLKWERDRFARLIWQAIVGPDRRKTTQIVDRYFSHLDSVKQLTPWQLQSKGVYLDKEIDDILGSSCIKDAVPWRIHHTFEEYHRQKAAEAALICTIAILRYKAEKGKLPPSLEQLVSAGYLRELPMDPYSDGPLVYKVLGDDFTLYSLGADLDDDYGISSDWGRRSGGGDQVFWPVETAEGRRN